MYDFNDRVVIVTGGASGIGKSVVQSLSGFGASVVIADVDTDLGNALAKDIEGRGGQALFVRTDVSKEAEVKNLVDATLDRFGKLDGAFNNAGVEQSIKPLHEIEDREWQRVIGINLSGVFYCMKYQIPAMIANGGGSIVNTSSSLGDMGMPMAAEYIASKHGVIGLTRAAAVEYARQGIRVNSVLPGMTDTPMIGRGPTDPELAKMFDQVIASVPAQRLGRPEEIANAVAWLLSASSTFVTGTAVPVDGGFLIS